ncbi:hypothetical protein AAC387_Pa03g3353 [Persea americana]
MFTRARAWLIRRRCTIREARASKERREESRERAERKKMLLEILNLVFVWVDGDSELNVDVPLVFKGEDVCPGLKKGGYLNTIRTSLKYLCPVEHIPPKIEVDLSNLDIGDKVLMSDVVGHPSLKLLSKNENMPVCKIMTRFGFGRISIKVVRRLEKKLSFLSLAGKEVGPGEDPIKRGWEV